MMFILVQGVLASNYQTNNKTRRDHQLSHQTSLHQRPNREIFEDIFRDFPEGYPQWYVFIFVFFLPRIITLAGIHDIQGTYGYSKVNYTRTRADAVFREKWSSRGDLGQHLLERFSSRSWLRRGVISCAPHSTNFVRRNVPQRREI